MLKPKPAREILKPEVVFPGLLIQTAKDSEKPESERIRHMLKWETLPANRDRVSLKSSTEPSQLYLYKLSVK